MDHVQALQEIIKLQKEKIIKLELELHIEKNKQQNQGSGLNIPQSQQWIPHNPFAGGGLITNIPNNVPQITSGYVQTIQNQNDNIQAQGEWANSGAGLMR